MKVQQLSVFLENRSGRLAEVARLLGDAGVNIRALSLADTADFGILRLIVNDVERAVEVLRRAGQTASLTDVVAVEVPDRPGGLAEILEPLQEQEVNVEYLYAFVEKSADRAVVVLRFDDVQAALDVLKQAGVVPLAAEKVYAL